ncbi:molybdenum cofactor guanylyltransferase MobA [Mesorhizobium sp. CAU 1732]|uniref:molybdenum cofactor guanylyltransferase MobA n=1 Tax=Mesorhizobium sp. CAU 1732 TaxID=3140358 RepID=UPI003261301E
MKPIAGLILAGGRSSRMDGSDKALVILKGSTLLERAVRRIGPQVDHLAINSNADASALPSLGLSIVPDRDTSFSGPLAGILAGLDWAAALPEPPAALVSVAVDTPFFPLDMVARLSGDSENRIVVASSSGMRHPTFALWPLSLRDALAAFLADGATLKVSAFIDDHPNATVEFDLDGGEDPFFNINTPDDLRRAQTIAEMLD